MSRIERNYYKSVASLGLEIDTYSIPVGKSLRITSIGGDSGNTPDTVVCVMYDRGGPGEVIIFSTHGDTSRPMDQTFVGGKDLKILLDNDAGSTETMGGFWRGNLG